jgi:hypothetical protein
VRVCDLATPVRDPCPWGLPYHCSRKHPHDTWIVVRQLFLLLWRSIPPGLLVVFEKPDRSYFTTYPPQGSSWGEVSNVRPGGEMYCEAHTRALAHLEDVDVTDPASTVAALQGSGLPHPLRSVHVCMCCCTFHLPPSPHTLIAFDDFLAP